MGQVVRLFEQYERHVVDSKQNDTAEIEAAAVLWHPDDEILLSVAFAAARNYRMRFHGITMSRGEATTKNYRKLEGFDPALGHRAQEATATARSLGFASHTQFEAPDGRPQRDLSLYAAQVAEVLVERNIDLVLSTTRMGERDSHDHTAAGMVAYLAAEQATRDNGRHIGVMIVQPGSRGNYIAEQIPGSLDIVSSVALANASQLRVEAADEYPDWFALNDEFAMHPDDWAELLEQQYPIQGTASHTYVKCGQLLVPHLIAA